MHAIQETSICSAVHYRRSLPETKESPSTLCHGAPPMNPPHRIMKAPSPRGPDEQTLGCRLGLSLADVTMRIPGRPPRAGWPSLLALKPGERSRDRGRLTMVREIHTTREAAFSKYLAPPTPRHGSLRGTENRGARWCRRRATFSTAQI